MIENIELVSSTQQEVLEVSNFENSELASTAEICEYINKNIPSEHLIGCPQIEYNPEASVFVNECPEALGAYDTRSGEIFINEHNSLEGSNGMLETITHEIGHNAHANLEKEAPHLAEHWSKMYRESLVKDFFVGDGFVSEYAKTSQYEDFAECYANYVRNPEALAFLCPEKYAFMDQYVFHQNSEMNLDFQVDGQLESLASQDFRCFSILA